MAKTRPGERKISARPMQFIWIVDCSGSMSVDAKIQSLNNAIDEAIPAMRDVAEENTFAEISVRVLTFSSGARWHVSQPTPVADFKWVDVEAEGVTDLGAGLKLVADELTVEKMGTRGYPPVLVLLSDGQPTDNWKDGLDALMSTPWGKRASRIAIAIGKDADEGPLRDFIGNVEFPVLRADNPQRLVTLIRWASSVVSKVASSPNIGAEEGKSDSPLPPPPPEDDVDVDDVW